MYISIAKSWLILILLKMRPNWLSELFPFKKRLHIRKHWLTMLYLLQVSSSTWLLHPKNAFITSDSLENVNGIVSFDEKVMGHYHLQNYYFQAGYWVSNSQGSIISLINGLQSRKMLYFVNWHSASYY